MKQQIYLFYRLGIVSLLSQIQHRASFLMLITAYFLSTLTDILGIWVLFDRFKMIQGWSLSEVALLYGIMHMGFGISEATSKGFDDFGEMVKRGDFDRVLLRPIGTLLQIATSRIQPMRMGRFFQGLLVLLWGCSQLEMTLFSYKALLIVLSIMGTACLFTGLFILTATLCFWTTESLEVMNIVTYGGVESGQYPLSIYKPLFRLFFTFVVPLACVAYYPVSALLHHPDVPFFLGTASPLFGIVFLWVSCRIWQCGVRRYRSTGG